MVIYFALMLSHVLLQATDKVLTPGRLKRTGVTQDREAAFQVELTENALRESNAGKRFVFSLEGSSTFRIKTSSVD